LYAGEKDQMFVEHEGVQYKVIGTDALAESLAALLAMRHGGHWTKKDGQVIYYNAGFLLEDYDYYMNKELNGDARH
jgi:predicted metalloprotease